MNEPKPEARSASRSRPAISLGFVTGITATIALVLWVVGKHALSLPPAPPLSELSADFGAISPPQEARIAETPQASTKYGYVGVSGRYLVDDPDQVVRDHYRKALSEAGWMYRGTRGSAEKWIDIYCKKDLEANVELIGRSSSLTFSFSTFWSSVSVRECT